jgi:hypothetical protein
MAIRSTGIAAAAVGLLLPIATWILLVLLMHLLMLRRHLLLLLMHLLWHRAAIFRRTILGDAHPPEVLDGRLTSSPHLGSVQRRSWSSPLAREAGRGKDKRKVNPTISSDLLGEWAGLVRGLSLLHAITSSVFFD